MRPELSAAREALVLAGDAASPVERYAAAQLAALRCAAVVVGRRTSPAPTRHPRTAWHLLARCAPRYAEWAEYFELTQRRLAAWRRLPHPPVGSRQADDHLRDAMLFYAAVEGDLAGCLAGSRERRTA